MLSKKSRVVLLTTIFALSLNGPLLAQDAVDPAQLALDYSGAIQANTKALTAYSWNQRSDVSMEDAEVVVILELVRYIHLNPLRAGIVENIKALGRYRYSGHGALMNNRMVEVLRSDLESTNLMVIDIYHPNSYLSYSHILIGWFIILHAVLYLQHRMSSSIEQSFSVQTTSCRYVRPDQFCWPVAWIHTSV